MTDCEVCRQHPAVVRALVPGTYRVRRVCLACLVGNEPGDAPEADTET